MQTPVLSPVSYATEKLFPVIVHHQLFQFLSLLVLPLEGTILTLEYVIPNIPYLFIGWACLKLGTAYRLAPGVDLPHKLMGLGQTIGPAFADFAPGLDPLDWLIGIVGAVGFRLLIYAKSKKAKKYRRDEEYGSARWSA